MSVAVQHAGRSNRRLDRPALVALVLGLAGIAYRLALLLFDVPGANSDEATFGLATIHIAEGRELPIYMYGQHYMGAVESYFAAPLFAAFGPSWLALRVPLLVLYAAFVFLMFVLTRRLYSPWLATFTVGLLALGSERVVRDQITAVGGRPEIKAAVALLLLLGLALGQGRVRRRWLAFAVFGLVAGLTVWVDWLVLPYLAAAGSVLLVGCWRELLRWAGPVLLAGFLVGVSPLIVDNLTAPSGEDSVSVFLELNGEGAGSASPTEQLRGGVLSGIPLATGLCPPERCAPWQMWWAVLYVPLLLAAAALALVDPRRPGTAVGEAQPSRRVRHAAQIALAAAAGLTVFGYVRSPAAAATPLASARYLSILQISLPAALWPLWRMARWSWHGSAATVPRRVCGMAASGLLAALSATMLFTTAAQVAQVRPIREEERRERMLAAEVRRAGIRDVYGDYWTCNRLIFATREQVACAVLRDNLRPGQDRYRPYRDRVYAANRPAFIFAVDDGADGAFQAYLRRYHVEATVTEVAGYRIYQPSVTVRPWL